MFINVYYYHILWAKYLQCQAKFFPTIETCSYFWCNCTAHSAERKRILSRLEKETCKYLGSLYLQSKRFWWKCRLERLPYSWTDSLWESHTLRRNSLDKKQTMKRGCWKSRIRSWCQLKVYQKCSTVSHKVQRSIQELRYQSKQMFERKYRILKV